MREMTRPPIELSIERSWREVAAIDDAYSRGESDAAGWHQRIAALLVPAYLAGADPRAQSGYTGTAEEREQARSLVADAIPRGGTFLDIGCASGLLMESVRAWCAQRGASVEPYGLEIAPELPALARSRLSGWADRIFDGNGAVWIPPAPFDFVRTGHDYVPPDRRSALMEELTRRVRPRGRAQ